LARLGADVPEVAAFICLLGVPYVAGAAGGGVNAGAVGAEGRGEDGGVVRLVAGELLPIRGVEHAGGPIPADGDQAGAAWVERHILDPIGVEAQDFRGL